MSTPHETPHTTAPYFPHGAPGRSHDEELRALWALPLAERIEAMRAGRLTHRQLYAWAGARPDTVPLLNGEFEFIAIATPEACEPQAPRVPRGTPTTPAAPADAYQLAVQILQDLGKLERRWSAYQRRFATDLAGQLILSEAP